MPVSNKIKLGALLGTLLSIIIAFWIAYTPPEFFVSPFYWIGFIPSAIVGAFFLLPSGPIFPVAGKPKPKRKLGYLPVAAVSGALLVASRVFPNALAIEFGIPIALFGGAGLRFFYLLVFQSHWSYCPKCEANTWILEVNGKWYCNKKGHLFQTTTSAKNDPSVEARNVRTQS
ncbi:MAG TPA: hypothetical protein VNW25_07455 [Candidatus Sulfotelmatobacter sp.]|nr:hypothetical protein [Candidatus Sulfotelmatobacter sp.]